MAEKITVDELNVKVNANSSNFQKELNKATSHLGQFETEILKKQQKISNFTNNIKKAVFGLGLGKILKDSLMNGMNAIENDSLFATTMGNFAKETSKWALEVSNALGLNANELKRTIGVIYNMSTSMGVGEKNALKLSKGISLLANDMASFYNIDSTEAFNKLRAGLTGETEPLKALGILVDENTIKQVAYANGIARVGSELTTEQKVLARYKAILQQTSNAQQDLARTIDSPSNQVRLFTNNIRNLSLEFSNLLMPATAVLSVLNAVVKVATIGIGALNSMLGLKRKDSNNAIEKVNKSTIGLGGSLNKANKEAKDLNSTLAGFDKMNVLQERNTSAGKSNGGASGVGGSTFELPDYDAGLDKLENKTKELTDKILKYFKNVGDNINFDKIGKSLDNLLASLKPFSNNIGSGLVWFYNEVLIPISKWSVNDLLPAFLTSLKGGIDFLNASIDAFKPFGMFLFENFLKPLGEFTGTAIVDLFTGIGQTLTTISQHEGAVKAIVFSLTALAGIQLVNWFKNLDEAIQIVNLKMFSLDEISKVYGNTTTKVAGKLAPLVAIYNKYNQILIKKVPILRKYGELIESVGKKMQSIPSAIEKIFIKLKDGEKFGDIFKKGINLAFDGFSNKTDSAANKLSEFTSNVENKFSNMIENIKSHSKTGDFFDGLLQTSKQKAISAFNAIASGAGTAFSAIGGGIKTIGTLIAANPLGLLVTAISVVASKSENLQEVLGNILSALDPLFKLAENLLLAILKPLVPILELIAQGIALILKPLEWAGNLIGGAVNALLGFFGVNQEGSKESEKASEEHKKAIDDVTESLRKEREEAEKNYGSKNQLTEKIKDAQLAVKKYNDVVEKTIEINKEDADTKEMLQRKQKEYNEAVKEEIQLTKSIKELKGQHIDLQLRLMDLEDRRKEKQEALNNAIKTYGENSREAQRASLELQQVDRDLADTHEKLKGNIDNTAKSERNLKGTISDQIYGLIDLAKNVTDNKEKANLYGEAIKLLNKTSGTQFDNLNKTIKSRMNEQGLIFNNQGKIIEKNYNDAFTNVQNKSSRFLRDFDRELDKKRTLKLNFEAAGAGRTIPFTFNMPTLRPHARGGIATKATPALIGEAGAEAVIPLENHTEWIDKVADKLNRNNNSQPPVTNVYIGEEKIEDIIVRTLENLSFKRNGRYL